jgi:molecular chaperone GrpE (heat shock protein)
MKIAQ